MPMLHPGEQAVSAEAIAWAVGPSGGPALRGSLYLSNHRLVFEALLHEGPMGSVPRTILDLNLSQVTNVGAVRAANGQLLLRVEAGPGFVYTFAPVDPQRWASAIWGSRTTLLATQPARPAPVASPSMVVQVKQESSTPLVFLHCRHCGSLSPAGTLRCASCGAGL